jgi:hypothetical protein
MFLQGGLSIMATLDAGFERELDVFQAEVETATQFYFAFLAVHDVAYHFKSVETLLNQAPLYFRRTIPSMYKRAFSWRLTDGSPPRCSRT